MMCAWNSICVKDFSINAFAHSQTHTHGAFAIKWMCRASNHASFSKCIDMFLTHKNGDRVSCNLLKWWLLTTFLAIAINYVACASLQKRPLIVSDTDRRGFKQCTHTQSDVMCFRSKRFLTAKTKLYWRIYMW